MCDFARMCDPRELGNQIGAPAKRSPFFRANFAVVLENTHVRCRGISPTLLFERLLTASTVGKNLKIVELMHVDHAAHFALVDVELFRQFCIFQSTPTNPLSP